MKIEHIAIWTLDLDKMKHFYEKFFNAKSNEKYFNPKKDFSSYFLSLESGARIELMHRPDISEMIVKFDSKGRFSSFCNFRWVSKKRWIHSLNQFARVDIA